MKIINKKNPIGDYVKLIFEPATADPKLARSERMWVRIIENLGNGKWKGILDNEPLNLVSIKFGDEVEFHVDQMMDFLDQKTKNTNLKGVEIPFEKRATAEPLIYKHTYHPNYKDLEKIAIPVDKSWDETFLKEELLIETLGPREYKLKCIPLCKKDLSYSDMIMFIENNRYNVVDGCYRNLLVEFNTNDLNILKKYKVLIIFEQNGDKAYIVTNKPLNIQEVHNVRPRRITLSSS